MLRWQFVTVFLLQLHPVACCFLCSAFKDMQEAQTEKKNNRQSPRKSWVEWLHLSVKFYCTPEATQKENGRQQFSLRAATMTTDIYEAEKNH